MPRNEERRVLLGDAAVSVLAQQGARGLTHRAVDASAGVPRGTASNYFATRDSIIDAILERIGERLAPGGEVPLEPGAADGRKAFAAYMRDIVRRLTSDRDAAIALFELRLEATRRSHVEATLSGWLRGGLQADVAFNEQQGLSGNRQHIVLFHYAITGLVLDQLTVPIDEGFDPSMAIDLLVEGLLPEQLEEPPAGTG